MDQPVCPFCATNMSHRPRPEFAHMFHLYVCDNCHAELKQFLVRPPQASPPAQQEGDGKVECPDCAFADITCFACDDPVCETHVRTIEKYSNYFQAGLRESLIQQYGGRIYCPLCFQATVKRHALSGAKKKPEKKHFFNFPLILGILSLCLVLVIAAKRCTPPPPDQEAPRQEIHEQSQ